MAKLLDEYAAIALWDVSTRQTNEGFIRRTIKHAPGHSEVRKVRGPILDQLYARPKSCGDVSCTDRSFTEHRNIPVLAVNPRWATHLSWRTLMRSVYFALPLGNDVGIAGLTTHARAALVAIAESKGFNALNKASRKYGNYAVSRDHTFKFASAELK